MTKERRWGQKEKEKCRRVKEREGGREIDR